VVVGLVKPLCITAVAVVLAVIVVLSLENLLVVVPVQKLR